MARFLSTRLMTPSTPLNCPSVKRIRRSTSVMDRSVSRKERWPRGSSTEAARMKLFITASGMVRTSEGPSR